jgi:hypothetical protein
MAEDASTTRAFVTYLLSLCLSLVAATVVVLPFEESPESGTLPRLVSVVTFFTVFTLLFLWCSGYLSR